MKNWAFLFLSLSSVFTFSATKLPVLKNGQCYADPDSKNYLVGLKASTNSSYDRIKSEIGLDKLQSLRDTPDKNYYFCQLTCLSDTGKPQQIWVTQSDSPAQFANMNGFLCAGVSIENVQIVGSIYGPQPVVSPFISYETDFPEVHQWLQKIGFTLNQLEYETKFAEMQKNLEKVALAYVQSSSPLLQDAGVQLWEIANKSEVGQKILSEKLDKLTHNNWKIELNSSSPDYYIEIMLKQWGRFLDYKMPETQPVYTIEGLRLYP